MIAIAQSKKDLTQPVSLRHSTPVTEKNVTGFGSPEFTRRTNRRSAVFLRPLHGLLNGRAV